MQGGKVATLLFSACVGFHKKGSFHTGTTLFVLLVLVDADKITLFFLYLSQLLSSSELEGRIVEGLSRDQF